MRANVPIRTVLYGHPSYLGRYITAVDDPPQNYIPVHAESRHGQLYRAHALHGEDLHPKCRHRAEWHLVYQIHPQTRTDYTIFLCCSGYSWIVSRGYIFSGDDGSDLIRTGTLLVTFGFKKGLFRNLVEQEMYRGRHFSAG